MESEKSAGFTRVGKVKDAHGIKGELFIVLFAGEAAWIEDLESIRLISPSQPEQVKIYNVKSARLHKNGLIAKTDSIKDRNEAELLKGWLLEIPDEFLVSEPGEKIFLKEIEGFKVFTDVKGEIGTITGFGTNGMQDLLLVKTSWGEFEIPFVEDFVDTLDFDTREIHLVLPTGLLGELDDAAEPDDASDADSGLDSGPDFGDE